jgi:mRNA-degrading endonuclease toxin of MazEF toxin-antitoxin module
MQPHRASVRVRQGVLTVTGVPAADGEVVEVIVIRGSGDSERYARAPVGQGEFSDAEDPLAGRAKAGTSSRMKRGELHWYTFRPPDKRRPVVLLTRDGVIEQLGEIIAVPVTRTIRGLATEVVFTSDDGMPVACAANFDHVGLCAARTDRRTDRRATCRAMVRGAVGATDRLWI